MKVKNRATGVVYPFDPEVWEQVKDSKHVAGVLIPVEGAKEPPEVTELKKKQEKVTDKTPSPVDEKKGDKA